jgi:RimJ/RimL family protein N-acetyltransferase
MTEAVSAMVHWARSRPDVKFILAETAALNIASQRVLERNSFQLFETKNAMSWWKIAVK